MSESFNPYVEWLGFTGGQQPADHYELLGIDRFQNDPATISHAADVLTSRIRRVRPGENLAAWQNLLDQLRLAKACLLDPASKAAYDASLGGPSQPSPEPVYSAPPAAQPPSGPVMALPPRSTWGAPPPTPPMAPQPLSPVAPQPSPVAPQPSPPVPVSPGGYAGSQPGPVPGPYATPAGAAAGANLPTDGSPGWTPPAPAASPAWNTPTAMPAASPPQAYGAPNPYYPAAPSPAAPWGGPSYPPQPAAAQGWNPAGQQPAAAQGWNPAGQQPAPAQGWNPAGQQPAAAQGWNPAGQQPPAAQGWNPAGPQPAAAQGWNPAGPQPPAAQGWNPAGPQPVTTQGWNPAGPQPAAAQGWNPAGPQPEPQPPLTPGPYPAQQPYPEANAWTNSPGATGYSPAGVAPTQGQPAGQPQGYPLMGAAPATPSWTPAGQGAPAQSWGYPPTVPAAQGMGLPTVPATQNVGFPPAATAAAAEYATAAPPAEASPAAQASFIDDALLESIKPSTTLSRKRVPQKSSMVRTLVNLVVLLAIVVACVLGFKYYQKNSKGSRTIKIDFPVSDAKPGTPDHVKPAEKPKPDPSKKPDAKPAEKPKPDSGKKPDAKPGAPDPAKVAEKPKPDPNKKPDGTGDPAKRQAFQRAVAAARIALSQRETAGLKRYLAVAAQNAQGPDDQAVIQRLTLMGDYLEKYWEGIGRTMSQLVAAEEIIIGKAHIAVVESDASSITVHVEGQNKTYTVAQLPRVLMHFLAERLLRKEPEAQVYYGVYLAISPKGDRDRARALLQEAAKHDSEVEKLLPELDEAPVPGGGDAAAAAKSAPPAKAKLDQILQTVRDKYKTDYDQATTSRAKGELAKILLDNGRTLFDDMDQRFGMLAAAREEAIAAGDAALACEAVDEMGKLHTIDVFKVKVTTLEGLGEAVRGLAGQRQLAETALAMAGTALDANRLEEASRLAKLAMSAASKAKNVPTIKQARMLYLQIENLRKQQPAEK